MDWTPVLVAALGVIQVLGLAWIARKVETVHKVVNSAADKLAANNAETVDRLTAVITAQQADD